MLFIKQFSLCHVSHTHTSRVIDICHTNMNLSYPFAAFTEGRPLEQHSYIKLWAGKCLTGSACCHTCVYVSSSWEPGLRGIEATFYYDFERDPENHQSQMLFDGGADTDWGSKVTTSARKRTHTNMCPLLFSFLIAWELAAGPETSHRAGKEARGEEESGQGSALCCVHVWEANFSSKPSQWEYRKNKHLKDLALRFS